MYVNIGSDFSVRKDAVVGVFDLDNTTWSKWTRQFLSQAQTAGEVIDATADLPKSFLVTSEFGMNRVYLTQYNAAVLVKRLEEE